MDFQNFLCQLLELQKIKIPLWANITSKIFDIPLYGFSDEFENGYGAAFIY